MPWHLKKCTMADCRVGVTQNFKYNRDTIEEVLLMLTRHLFILFCFNVNHTSNIDDES